MSHRPALVIFDCDGVLVDSEPIFNRVLHQFLHSHGARFSLVETETLFTGKNRYAVEEHMKTLGLDLPPNWSDTFYARAIAALAAEVQPIPGIREALQLLRQAGVPLCVASNGLMAKMQATLGKTDLLPFFGDRLYSSYDIGASKPAPDVFLHAAREHGVDPADCFVIEDSPSGFAAAEAAAMPCLAYRPAPDMALFGAQPFEHMSELPARLHLR